jgi:glycosyltransferase involved in cell wall biosynthesis
MRVLHTVKDYRKEDGGVSVVLAQLLPVLAGMESSFRFELGSWKAQTSGEMPGIKHHIFSGGRSRANKLARAMVDAVLLHDHGLWLPNNHQVARICSKQAIPYVVSTHGMLEPWAMQFNAWKKRIAWYLFQKKDLSTARVIHSTAEQESANLQKFGLGVPIATIPLGIGLPEILPKRTYSKKKRILFLSRIQKKKGLDMLVDAWAEIRNPDWEIIMAGPDENGEQQRITALINEKKLKESVRFIPPVWGEEKWQLYRSADLFVLPTHSENFGLVIGEALGCAVPVITTQGAPWNVLEDYACGWWTEVNTYGIRDALLAAIQLSDEEREAMGERGRRLIQQKYSWQQVARQMLQLYAWVLGQSEKPDFVNDAH